MAELDDLVAPDCVIPTLKAGSKKQALQELSHRAADHVPVAARDIFQTLIGRERLGTTGVGGGIAIPHGKVAGLDHCFGMFAKLHQPVDFDAVDDKPVDLIFLLLAPESDDGNLHLKALARIARALRDRPFCEKLRTSSSADALYALMRAGEEQAA